MKEIEKALMGKVGRKQQTWEACGAGAVSRGAAQSLPEIRGIIAGDTYGIKVRKLIGSDLF